MFMARRIFFAAGWTGLFLSLIACGGGGGSNGSKGVATSPLNVNMGDAPSDRIVAFGLTVNSVALAGSGVNPTVLSTATPVEFAHRSGTVAPLSLAAVADTTYSSVTITVSNPRMTIIDDLGNAVAANVTLPQTSFSVPLNATVPAAASTLNLDLNLAQSVSLNLAVNPPAATITPVFSASLVSNASASQQTAETGGFEDVTGVITAATGSSFTIGVAQTGQALTFNTDSNTAFSGVSGVSALQTGTVVEVNGVTRSDGTLLATAVALRVGVAGGLEVEGLVTGVTGNPATGLQMAVRDEASSSASRPAPGDIVTTDISAVAANKFLLNSTADLTGLTVAFNAGLVALGQSLEIDAGTAAANNIVADQVHLRDGTLTGAITGTIFPLVNGGTQFTLTLPPDSQLVKLTSVTANPVTSVTVIRQPSTAMLNGVTVTPALAVRVRGPLFFDGTNYTLVAVRMTTP